MLAELDANEPRVTEAAFAVRDVSTPHDAKIHLRGDPAKRGEVAPRGYVGVIAGARGL